MCWDISKGKAITALTTQSKATVKDSFMVTANLLQKSFFSFFFSCIWEGGPRKDLKLQKDENPCSKALIHHSRCSVQEDERYWNTAAVLLSWHLPVGHYTRVVTLLVVIHFHITHQNKGRVSAIGSDYTTASDGLREMGVYGRAADWLQAL